MRSPADRPGLELVFRLLAAIALAWLVAGAFLERRPQGGEIVDVKDLPVALERWTMAPPGDSLGLRLTAAPDQAARDYLGALNANGTAIVWQNTGISPLMLEGEAVQDPAGGVIVRLTGEESTIVVRDTLGLLDSARVSHPGTTIRLPAAMGTIAAQAGSTVASVATSAPATGRSVVVLGMAGWESKFTIRALEERGWKVESRLAIAPRLSTGQGRPFPLDTARQVAVVALDSSAATYATEIYRFVETGGGLVLGEGAGAYFQRTAPAAVGELVRPVLTVSGGGEFRQRLEYRRLGPLRQDAVKLEERNGGASLAARRVGSGRVIQSGYRDTWRWRLSGEGNSVAEHRGWWAALVATVAYRSASPAAPNADADPAPLASLVQALGDPGILPAENSPPRFWPVLLAVFLAATFSEWLSRRLRGAA